MTYLILIIYNNMMRIVILPKRRFLYNLVNNKILIYAIKIVIQFISEVVSVHTYRKFTCGQLR